MHELRSLFDPGRIAVIGASPDTGGIRGRFYDFLVRGGYPGDILPVNPSYREIDGRPCFPTITTAAAQAAGPIDLAAIVIPANGVLAELERCAAAGVKNALIVSSGFAEEGGARSELQKQMVAVARAAGMRIVGPNSEGFLNARARVSATFSPTVELALAAAAGEGRKRIAVIAQSGGMGFGIMHRGLKAGLAFSFAISTGNEADVTLADCLSYMIEDPHTDAVALFMESVRDAAAFEAACVRALALDKPIVAIKVGRSAAGQRAAQSHTASIAGWSAAYDAFFAKYAVVPCADPSESTAILGALTTCSTLIGNRVAVLTPSGGAGALISDTFERHGFVLPVLSERTQQLIKPSIPSYATAQNPVDVTAGATRTGAAVRAAEVLLAADEIDLLVTVHSLTSESSVSVDPQVLARAARAAGKPLTAFCYTEPSHYGRARMAEAGIYVNADAQLMAGALAKVLERRRQVERLSRASRPALDSEFSARVAAALERGFATAAADVLCEYEVKTLLRELGVEASREVLCRSGDEAVAAAERLGYPVALKIQSPAIAHKTEAGGVRIGLDDAAAVRAAHAAILAAVSKSAPGAPLRGVLVQQMAPAGYEVIIGMIRDPTFGPVMMVGLGGVAVELYRDVAYRPAPLAPDEAETMLRSLKSSALFDGFRGKPPVSLHPLAALVARVSCIAAAAHASRTPIAELELNPVIVHADGSGITIADALLRR